MHRTRRDRDKNGDRDILLRRVARSHRVSTAWLRLVSEGTLDDPDCVRAIRKAAMKPSLWTLVSPAVKEALCIPELKVRQLGGRRDDLLASLLQAHELNTPHNRNYFSRPGAALEVVTLWLDLELEKRRDAILESSAKRRETGRRTIVDARSKKAEKAVKRAEALQIEIVERMAAGKARPVAIRAVAKARDVTPDAIRKTLRNLAQKNATN
jgi:hypothetical protein